MTSKGNDIAAYGEDRTSEKKDLFDASDDENNEFYHDDGYRASETGGAEMQMNQKSLESPKQNRDQIQGTDEGEVDLQDRLHDSDNEDDDGNQTRENLGDIFDALESESEASEADEEQQDGDRETDDVEADHEASLPSMLETASEIEDKVDDEVKSAWSDDSSSSDGDEYMNVAEETIARKSLGKNKAGDTDNNSSQEVEEEAANAIIDEYSNDNTTKDAHNKTAEIELDESPVEEEYNFNDEKKWWLRNADLDEAILPIGCHGEDDMFRRDAQYYHEGTIPDRKRIVPTWRSHGNPSLFHPSGALTRARFHREQAVNDRKILEKELKAANTEIEESSKQIGTLKNAVESRQKSLEAESEKLEKWKGYTEWWKGNANTWKSAFDKQRPLADAERERQLMIEAGIENNQSAETQTSPVEVLSYNTRPEGQPQYANAQTSPIETLLPRIIEEIQSKQGSTEIDNVDLVDEDFMALARERDDLLQENETLTAQTERLKKLLEDFKEWSEARDWVLKGPQDVEPQPDDDEIPEGLDELAASALFSPTAEVSPDDFELPPDSTMLGWPESWIEREEEMRRSANWIQNRDKVAAELDAWERQYLAHANTSTNVVACA